MTSSRLSLSNCSFGNCLIMLIFDAQCVRESNGKAQTEVIVYMVVW